MDETLLWINTIEKEGIYLAEDTRHFRKNALYPFDLFHQILLKYTHSGDTCLEAGCGKAYASFHLAHHGFEVTAMDISSVLLSHLGSIKRAVFQNEKLNLAFLEWDIFNLRNLNRRFHIIFNHGVYEHFLQSKTRLDALSNIQHTLLPGGYYIVAVPNLKNPLFNLGLKKVGVPAMVSFDISTLTKELESVGFKVIESGYLFVGLGFEEWLSFKPLKFPIRFFTRLYPLLPKLLRKLLGAHIYCVAQK